MENLSLTHDLLEAKKNLYGLLLKKGGENWTEAETDIAFHLSQDSDIHAFMERGLRGAPVETVKEQETPVQKVLVVVPSDDNDDCSLLFIAPAGMSVADANKYASNVIKRATDDEGDRSGEVIGFLEVLGYASLGNPTVANIPEGITAVTVTEPLYPLCDEETGEIRSPVLIAQMLKSLQELVPHVMHYASMPHAYADAHKDAADARAVLGKAKAFLKLT